MANKDWWESFSPSDCLKIGSWEDMVDYIQHSACTDFTIYSQCTDTNPVFKFGGNNDIEFDGDRAIMIDDDETYIGHGAGDAITNGEGNTFIGKDAGTLITTGDNNVFLGALAGAATGVNVISCVFVGVSAGQNNTTNGNVGIGYEALINNTGSANLAIGYRALDAALTGDSNIGIGDAALGENRGGSNNIGIGVSTLGANTTGNDNVGIGYRTLVANTTGIQNLAIGTVALDALTSGDYNVAIGNAALSSLTSGSSNVAIGRFALYADATLNGCVAIGAEAGRNNAADDRLYINNTASAFPLIYGEFDNDVVKFGNNADDWGLIFDIATGGIGKIFGGDDTGDDLLLTANSSDNCSWTKWFGDAGITMAIKAASGFEVSTCSLETLWEIDSSPADKHVDFHCLDAHNFVLELRTSDPSSPTCTGQIWFRTDLV